MKRVFSVYNTFYVKEGKSGIDFLRDAIGYFNARNEVLNEKKSIFLLLSDWAKRVEFNAHTRY